MRKPPLKLLEKPKKTAPQAQNATNCQMTVDTCRDTIYSVTAKEFYKILILGVAFDIQMVYNRLTDENRRQNLPRFCDRNSRSY